MSTEKTYQTRCPDCRTVHEIEASVYEGIYPRFGAATCPKCKLRYSPTGNIISYTPSEDAVGKIARARADIAAALEERRIVDTLISLGWTPPGEKHPAVAQEPADVVPTSNWVRVVDQEMVNAHLGVANESDSYEEAKKKLNTLICWNVDAAKDPSINGGLKLYPAELVRKLVEALKYHQDQTRPIQRTIDALSKAKEHGL